MTVSIGISTDDIAIELVTGDGNGLMELLDSCAVYVDNKYAASEPFDKRCDVFLERTAWVLDEKAVVLVEKIAAWARARSTL